MMNEREVVEAITTELRERRDEKLVELRAKLATLTERAIKAGVPLP